MTIEMTAGELDRRFSSDDAAPVEWSRVQAELERAETYWITTVRSDGRPHATPLVAVWLDDAVWFCTGPTEQKARNLEHNESCLVSTGCNAFYGLDVVIEGAAERVTEEAALQRTADRYASKYDPPFHFTVRDGAFAMAGDDNVAHVFRVNARKILAFEKGDTFSQTRWRRS